MIAVLGIAALQLRSADDRQLLLSLLWHHAWLCSGSLLIVTGGDGTEVQNRCTSPRDFCP